MFTTKSRQRKRTTVSAPFELFESLRIPFGVKNAAQTYQRLITGIADYNVTRLLERRHPNNSLVLRTAQTAPIHSLL